MLNRYHVGTGITFKHSLANFDLEGDTYTETSDLDFAIKCLERFRSLSNNATVGYIYDKQELVYLN